MTNATTFPTFETQCEVYTETAANNPHILVLFEDAIDNPDYIEVEGNHKEGYLLTYKGDNGQTIKFALSGSVAEDLIGTHADYDDWEALESNGEWSCTSEYQSAASLGTTCDLVTPYCDFNFLGDKGAEVIFRHALKQIEAS